MALQKYIVSKDDSIYEAWPDIALTKSGNLICVFSECEHHGNRDNARIVYCHSLDRGNTWSKKTALTKKGTKEGVL
ncbi:MAG: sialidase family protein [Clostridia bacterium]